MPEPSIDATDESIALEPDPTGPGELVGTYEAAKILGVEAPQVSRWRADGRMPRPVAVLRATHVWLRADVVRMKRERGR